MNQAQDEVVTFLREDFEDFKRCTKLYRTQVIGDIASIKTALFAKDANNEHDSVGLMTSARIIDRHITVTCNFVKWGIAGAGAVTVMIGLWHAVETLI